MHHIDGLSTAAAQYQAYLERMRVAHAEDAEKKVRRRNGGQKFQDEPEAEDEDSSSEDGENGDHGGEESPQPDAAADHGFGSHYA